MYAQSSKVDVGSPARGHPFDQVLGPSQTATLSSSVPVLARRSLVGFIDEGLSVSKNERVSSAKSQTPAFKSQTCISSEKEAGGNLSLIFSPGRF